MIAGFFAFLLVFTVLGSFPIVPETKQAVVVRFGKPVRILNRYEAGKPIGAPGAGISWRIPFADEVVWIDKRVLDVDMQRQQVLSTDQRRLQVDAFARYRIVDPLLMFIRARSEKQLNDQLRPILGSEVRNELGKVTFAALLTPERQGVMDNVRISLNNIARGYGVEILDVRIKRTDLPDGAPLNSAFGRMRTAREQEARSIRAQGAKQAQIIRAEADAQAARTYAESFGKDPQFYDFYRAMQAYQITFVGDEQNRPSATTMILSPQNDFLKEFSGRPR
ncbi:MAG: protease modulator HflC [Sphingomonas sp.]|nr:protease modulator HflC [Sphingomonas sp.]